MLIFIGYFTKNEVINSQIGEMIAQIVQFFSQVP